MSGDEEAGRGEQEGGSSPPSPRSGEPVLRRAGPSDSDLFLTWRNDAEVVRRSLTGRGVERDAHQFWFQRRLEDEGTVMLVGETADGVPVGQVRLQAEEAQSDVYEVTISVDAEFRGRGWGQALLLRVCEMARTTVSAGRLSARVRRDNPVSLRAFARAGFVPGDSSDPEVVLLYLSLDGRGKLEEP